MVAAMVRVKGVAEASIAHELGIVSGTELLTVNGRELADFLDWEFLTADEELVIEGRLPDGEQVIYEVERPEGEAMGVELEPPTIRRCANRCEFCFIEGLPKGLRKPLYVRDDDYRLSFAYGNFATLSNVKDRDIARILEYRLSPLYVSVHATPWEARKVLLNNPRVPNIVDQLTQLAAGGIQFHGQMVIVPGLNDGDVLEQSLTDLWNLGDAVLSVAIVPVGLTQFSHLYTGKPMDEERASGLLDVVDRWSVRARRERGAAWVYGSDELYLLAKRELPPAEHYDDFPQIENGVGAVASLRERVREGVASLAAPRRKAHCGGHGSVDGTADARAAGTRSPKRRAPNSGSSWRRTRCSDPPRPRLGFSLALTFAVASSARETAIWCSFRPSASTTTASFSTRNHSSHCVRSRAFPVVPSYDFIDVLTSDEVLSLRGMAA
jgi:putative radical SAM enzyme (TIGR03279 family)